jgi:hypothetical protein
MELLIGGLFSFLTSELNHLTALINIYFIGRNCEPIYLAGVGLGEAVTRIFTFGIIKTFTIGAGYDIRAAHNG